MHVGKKIKSEDRICTFISVTIYRRINSPCFSLLALNKYFVLNVCYNVWSGNISLSEGNHFALWAGKHLSFGLLLRNIARFKYSAFCFVTFRKSPAGPVIPSWTERSEGADGGVRLDVCLNIAGMHGKRAAVHQFPFLHVFMHTFQKNGCIMWPTLIHLNVSESEGSLLVRRSTPCSVLLIYTESTLKAERRIQTN